MTRFISPREDVKLLVVSVPEDAIEFEVADTPDFGIYLDFAFNDGAAGNRKLPPGDYLPLGIATELREEVLKELVEKKGKFGKRVDLWMDYEYTGSHFYTPTESFASFLRREGITERVYVLKVKEGK